jgi:hypothetical protein
LLVILQKAMDSVCFSEKIYKMLLEHVNDIEWQKRLKSCFSCIQKQYELLQYIHLLRNGNDYKRQVNEPTYYPMAELIHTGFFNEINKLQLYHQLVIHLSGAEKKVMTSALHQSLDCAKMLLDMLEDAPVQQSHLLHEIHE